jgi:hypothetical protein
MESAYLEGAPLLNTLRRMLALGSGWALLLLAGEVAADSFPMDLHDPTPRWGAVEFEVSPSERPGQQDFRYTQKLPAWIEPDARPGWIRVTTPGWAIESIVMAHENPVPGSFSDFVWVLEPATGQVIEARVSGTVVRELDIGFFSRNVETRIEVVMTTRSVAGYRAPTTLLGQTLYRHCSENASGCTLVAPTPYDTRTGHVNAVGGIAATAGGVGARTFSPLGEARFSEIDGAPWLQTASSAAGQELAAN